MSPDNINPSSFDPPLVKACGDVEISTSRGGVEARGRKTHKVQGNRLHQAQVAAFSNRRARGAGRQECREIEIHFSKGLSSA